MTSMSMSIYIVCDSSHQSPINHQEVTDHWPCHLVSVMSHQPLFHTELCPLWPPRELNSRSELIAYLGQALSPRDTHRDTQGNVKLFSPASIIQHGVSAPGILASRPLRNGKMKLFYNDFRFIRKYGVGRQTKFPLPSPRALAVSATPRSSGRVFSVDTLIAPQNMASSSFIFDGFSRE